MKKFSKVLVIVLFSMLCTAGIAFAHNIAPTLTPSIESGSVVEPGVDKLVVTIKAAANTTIKECTYSWNGATQKSIFNTTGLVGKQNTLNVIPFSFGTFSSTEGQNKLTMAVVDQYGNIAKEEFVYIVKANNTGDTTAPTISMNKASGSTVTAGSNLTLTVVDNESKITTLRYNWEGSSVKNIIPSVKVPANRCQVTEIAIGVKAGTYKLNVTAINENGKTSQKTFTYYVQGQYASDTTAPVISMNKASGSTVVAGSNLTLTVEDNESKVTTLRYNWEGSSVVNMIPSVRVPANRCQVGIAIGVKAGTYRLNVTAINENGKTSQKTFTYYVQGQYASDTTAPVISMSKASGSTVTAGSNLTLTVEDNESKVTTLRYNWEGSSVKDLIPSVKEPANRCEVTGIIIGVKAGTYRLHVTAINENGKTSQKTFTYYVQEQYVSDTTAPVISMSKANGSTLKARTNLTLTVEDNESKVTTLRYNWEGSSVVSLIPSVKEPANRCEVTSITIGEKAGTYRLHVTAINENGKASQKTFTYYVETNIKEEFPTVDADPDGGDVEYGDKITITAEDEDGDIKYVEYYWDDEEDDTTKKYDDEFTVKVPSDEGKHYLYVRAMDDDGNLCDYERFTYYIEENYYPGNSDIIGDINNKVRALRVEIRNADDKIRFEPKEDILYYVDYYNGSSKDIKNVKLVVELPTYLKAEDASDNGKISSQKITWSLGTLEEGEYGRVSFIAYYNSSKVNEKLITVPAKIYSGSSVKDTSTVRNMIFCEGASGTGHHEAYCVGYPDGTFRAEGRITRAELASMIANIEEITAAYRGQFTDVNNHWAANYIQAVVDNGYMLPRSYNTFGAQDYATRADLAYAIAAILDVEDLEPIFISATDTEYNDARCAIEQLLRLGIMDGYSDGSVRPNSNITRAEAVTIINNYLFRGELYTKGYKYAYNFETSYNHGGIGYVLRFTDLSTNHWAYGQIMEATNNHRYERVMDGNEEML